MRNLNLPCRIVEKNTNDKEGEFFHSFFQEQKIKTRLSYSSYDVYTRKRDNRGDFTSSAELSSIGTTFQATTANPTRVPGCLLAYLPSYHHQDRLLQEIGKHSR